VEDVCDRVVIYYGGKVQAMGTLAELLARPDTLRITMPVLSRDSLERALEIIRKDVAADKVRVDNPTQNLESYFLEVVEKAKRAAAETSGATSGHRVAEYLRGSGVAKPSTDKLLERLTLPQSAPAAPVIETPATGTVDTQKLEALTRATEPSTPKPAPAPAQSVSEAELRQADEKLSSLLGKKP
jgi:ABC-type glutathione transport system ATPase component